MKEIVSSGTSWDYETALKNALREREELLKANPDLQVLQKKIDASLSKTDVFEDKMKILGQMIGDSLNRLHDECSTLSDICNEIGIDVKLPILELKNKALLLGNRSLNN